MRSAFFEFNVATSGLFLARGALEVVSHNTANAAITGYSRQYVETRATRPLVYYDGRGAIGTGAEIYGIGQYRNFYLDKKYWSERAVLGEYQVKYTNMSMVESMFGEMANAGTSAGINQFFQTLEDLHTTAGDTTYRTNVLKSAQSLTEYINNAANTLRKYQRDLNEEVKTVVQRINSLGQQIASLNKQIATYELDGSQANDLRDARARLVDELSIYVNVEVSEVERNEAYAQGKYPEPEDRGRSQKEFTVMINGYELVKGNDAYGLTTVARDLDTDKYPLSGTKNNPLDINGLYDVYFTNGQKFDIYSTGLKGQLKGLIDARDGNNALYFKAGAGSITQSGNSVTIDPDTYSRLDLNQDAEGTISVISSNGRRYELRYTSVTANADGTYTFDIDPDELAKLPATFDWTTASATVGKTTDYKGIPHYLDKLNEFVRTLAKAFNEGKDRNGNDIDGVVGHQNGYDWPDDENKGLLFFSYKDNVSSTTMDYQMLNCMNFSVNQALIDNPEWLAASSKQGAGESQNEIIMQFLELKQYKGLFAEGKIDDYIIGISSELAIDVNQAKNFTKNYTEVTTQIDQQRMSVSGVDLNEEMTDMIKYQHLYQACSKLINIIDGIYDTTINRLGLI